MIEAFHAYWAAKVVANPQFSRSTSTKMTITTEEFRRHLCLAYSAGHAKGKGEKSFMEEIFGK
jgi:hypothetical protein